MTKPELFIDKYIDWFRDVMGCLGKNVPNNNSAVFYLQKG